jgi:hypothetical protein
MVGIDGIRKLPPNAVGRASFDFRPDHSVMLSEHLPDGRFTEADVAGGRVSRRSAIRDIEHAVYV